MKNRCSERKEKIILKRTKKMGEGRRKRRERVERERDRETYTERERKRERDSSCSETCRHWVTDSMCTLLGRGDKGIDRETIGDDIFYEDNTIKSTGAFWEIGGILYCYEVTSLGQKG